MAKLVSVKLVTFSKQIAQNYESYILFSTIISVQMSKTATTYGSSQSQPPLDSPSWRDRLFTQDYQQLVNTFNILDENGTGVIDQSELKDCLKQLSSNDKSNPFILDLINGLIQLNQSITLDIFIGFMTSNVGDLKTRDGIQKVFNIYDKDSSQYVDKDEFKNVATQIHDCITEAEIEEMIHTIYVNYATSSQESLCFDDFFNVVSSYVQ